MYLALFDILTRVGSAEVVGTPREVVASVQAHLHRLFNARRGSLVHQPEYGLPDLGVVYENLPYSVEDLARQVHRLVETYEPRLSAVRVRQIGRVGNDRRIHLEIAGSLSGHGYVSFQTVFESAGSARVQSRRGDKAHA